MGWIYMCCAYTFRTVERAQHHAPVHSDKRESWSQRRVVQQEARRGRVRTALKSSCAARGRTPPLRLKRRAGSSVQISR
jgi:hypothetical protein